MDEVKKVSLALGETVVFLGSCGATQVLFVRHSSLLGLWLVVRKAHINLNVNLIELLIITAGSLVSKYLLKEFLMVVVYLLLVLAGDAIIASHGTPAVGHSTIHGRKIEGAPLHLLLTFALDGFLAGTTRTTLFIAYGLAVTF